MSSSTMQRVRSHTKPVTLIVGALVLAFALAVLVVACGGEDGLVGKWKDSNGIITEFTEDGKVLTDDPEMAGMEMTYEDDGEVITLDVMGVELTMSYSIDGDTMTIDDPVTGEPDTVTRVK